MTDRPTAAIVQPPRPGRPLVIAFDDPDGAGLPGRVARRPGADRGWIELDDPARAGFYAGIPGLGDSIEAAARALREWVDELTPGSVATLGAGPVAGHAALVYGALIGADRVVAVEPLAHLIPEVRALYHDHRPFPGLARAPDPDLARRWDGADLLARSGDGGPVHVLLGSRRANDHPDAVHQAAIHAEWLARSPRVRLHRLDQLAPGLAEGGDGREEVDDLIARLLDGAAEHAPPSPAPAPPSADGRPPLAYDGRLTICRYPADHPANRTGAPVAFAAAGHVDPDATRRMTDDLRAWIVANLLLDAEPADLAANLLRLGISRRETLREVDLARFHPYFLANRRVLDRLAKRDWQLGIYRKLDRLRPRRRPFEVERAPLPPGPEFLRTYYAAGRPVHLVGALAARPALASWAFDALRARLGATEVHPADAAGIPIPATLTDALDGIARSDTDASWTLDVRESNANRGVWEALVPDLGPLVPGFDLVDPRAVACWFGPGGSAPPPPPRDVPHFVGQVVGRLLAAIVPPWDVDRRADLARADPDAGGRPPGLAASSFPPADQPEVLEAVLEPGDLLFLPAGSDCRLAVLGPAALALAPGLLPLANPP